jgi:lysophospholipase L1-like esterase
LIHGPGGGVGGIGIGVGYEWTPNLNGVDSYGGLINNLVFPNNTSWTVDFDVYYTTDVVGIPWASKDNGSYFLQREADTTHVGDVGAGTFVTSETVVKDSLAHYSLVSTSGVVTFSVNGSTPESMGASSGMTVGILAAYYQNIVNMSGQLHNFVYDNTDVPLDSVDIDTIINSGQMPAYSGFTYSAALGDSTIDNAFGTQYVIDLVPTTFVRVNMANSGDTIVEQQAVWTSSLDKDKQAWVCIQIGLNDVIYTKPVATSIAELQTFVDTVVADTSPGAQVIVGQMSPGKEAWITRDGPVNGLLTYQNWIDLNEAIAGAGPTPITGVTGRALSHNATLDDGNGNLKLQYQVDIGGGQTDGIHTNDAARQIVADSWSGVIQELKSGNIFDELTGDRIGSWFKLGVDQPYVPVLRGGAIDQSNDPLKYEAYNGSFTSGDFLNGVDTTNQKITSLGSPEVGSWLGGSGTTPVVNSIIVAKNGSVIQMSATDGLDTYDYVELQP